MKSIKINFKTGIRRAALFVISGKRVKATVVLTFMLMLVSLITSCWNKQEHEVTAPKTPVYIVSGIARDRDSGDILSGIRVVLSAVSLIYEYDFTSASDTTDQTGYYEFLDITPGMYQIKAYRDGFPVNDNSLVVEHKDKTFDINLPKPLIAKTFYGPPKYKVFSGICWRYSEVLAGVYFYYHRGASSIYVGNFADDFQLLGRYDLIIENPEFHGLAYLGSYWAAGGTDEAPKIYSIDPAKGNIDGITDIDYSVVDLTSDGNSLWGTASVGKIIQFGEHPSVVSSIYNTEIVNPAGIAWDGNNIWTSDSLDGMVFKNDRDISIIESYRTFFWDNALKEYRPLNLVYLTFDPSGTLWGSDGVSIYKF